MDEMVVLVPTAGRPDLLRRTLESLSQCRRPACYRGTVVVENGGRHGAEAVVEAFAGSLNCRYLFVEDGNKSLALNKALETLGNTFIYFTDDDVRFDPGTLEAYAAVAGDCSGGNYFGGPTGVDYEQEPPDWLRRYLPLSAQGWRPKPDEPTDCLNFLGFNWGAFASDIRRLGGFDVNRGPGAPTGSTGQESEMQFRLRSAGATSVYVPEAMVWHYVPSDRCSPQWTITRAYRNGVQVGLMSPPARIAFRGQPLWVLLRHVKGCIRHVWASITRDPQFGFDTQVRRSHCRGLTAGFRLNYHAAGTAAARAAATVPRETLTAEPPAPDVARVT